MKRKHLINLCLSAMFLSMGLILPFFTSQIEEIGSALLPLHLPVMLCGLICGPVYGAAVGFILPFMRSVLFSMPRIYPDAVYMAAELFSYGLIIGLVYLILKKKNTLTVYISLISAQIAGRIVWGTVKAILLGIGGEAFMLKAFFVGGFVNALPGIILQLILIPIIMLLIKRKKSTQVR